MVHLFMVINALYFFFENLKNVKLFLFGFVSYGGEVVEIIMIYPLKYLYNSFINYIINLLYICTKASLIIYTILCVRGEFKSTFHR